MCIVAALVSLIALLPAFISVRIAGAALQKSDSEVAPQVREDQKKQGRAIALVNALLPIATATTSPSQAAITAISLKPAGMRINSLSYKKGTVVVIGIADKREAISAYRDALEKSGQYTSVAVPIAALVGSQEGRFTITLTGAF